MEVKYINPFISSIINCLEMMIGITPERKPPFIKSNSSGEGDVTGMIGFADKNVIGSLAISFPTNTALMVYNSMTGEEVFQVTRNVQDSIGEIANIVTGGAKTELAEQGLSFHISIPTIIVGKNHEIHHKVDSPVMAIPFSLDKHQFVMEVAMKIL